MDIIDEFKQRWKQLDKTSGVAEEFPEYVVNFGIQIKDFMRPENRKYQGAAGNSRGMLDALVMYANTTKVIDPVRFNASVKEVFAFLLKIRLTSQVPLNTAFFIMQRLKHMDPATSTVDDLKAALLKECEFHLSNYKIVKKKIAMNMAARIVDRCEEYEQESIIVGTHCHSSAVVAALKESKDHIREVVVTKTEPEQQGVLTAKNLCDAGMNVRLISVSQYGTEFRRVNMFLFGIDAVSVEGIVLNKAGTRMIATLAHTKELPVYFLGSTYKYARDTLRGGLIRVERRDVADKLLFNHLGVDLQSYVASGLLTTHYSAFDTTRPEFYNSCVSECGFLPMREAFQIAWGHLLK